MANTSPTPYSLTVFFKDREPIKLQYVKSIYYVHNWLLKKFKSYWYMNIYNRKTGKYLHRQYVDAFIIDKPIY